MYLEKSDLDAFQVIEQTKAQEMILDAESMAQLVAPCLSDEALLDPENVRFFRQIKAVLRAAVLRWDEAGTGIHSQQGMGPFTQSTDTRQPRRGMFWPSEIQQLQAVCRAFSGEGSSKAYSIDLINGGGTSITGGHAMWCDVYFSGMSCSCGSVINGGDGPLYGVL